MMLDESIAKKLARHKAFRRESHFNRYKYKLTFTVFLELSVQVFCCFFPAEKAEYKCTGLKTNVNKM